MPNHPYKYVSKIYPHLMEHINYRKWADYYYSFLKKKFPKNAKVLELAAGNGKLAQSLKRYFPDIFISDISLDMLKQSKIRNLICFDMTMIPLKGKFEIIICAFDSINYLMRKQLINKLFSETYRLLSDDGIFSFDVSLEKNSLKNTEFLNNTGTFENYSYVQRSTYNKARHIHYNKFEICADDGTKFKEIHKQRIYPVTLYFELLDKNNFYVKNCFDAFTFKDAGLYSERVQFIAYKDKSKC